MTIEQTKAIEAYRKAQTQFRRACTIHDREQKLGRRDTGVRQTRRMYNAVVSMQRAAFKLQDAKRTYHRLIVGVEGA